MLIRLHYELSMNGIHNRYFISTIQDESFIDLIEKMAVEENLQFELLNIIDNIIYIQICGIFCTIHNDANGEYIIKDDFNPYILQNNKNIKFLNRIAATISLRRNNE